MLRKITLFYLLILMCSCGKDVVIIEEPNPPTEIDEIYEINFVGFITDGDRNHIPGSEISIDGYSITSDESGFFHFESVFFGRKGKAIYAKKEGFLPSVFRVTNNQSLSPVVLNLQMAKANEKTTLDDLGGIIQDENGTLTVSKNTVSASTDFTFQSFVGLDANSSNMDQLIFGVNTEFLLKEASFYIDGSSPLKANSALDVELEMDKFNNTDISDLAVFYYSEEEFRWKEKNIALTNIGGKLSVTVDSYGWWTIAEKVHAQYGGLSLNEIEESPIGGVETKISYKNGTYGGSTLYTHAGGSIYNFFPSETSITVSLNNGAFKSENESGFAIADYTSSCKIIFDEQVQTDIFGKVYDCDFMLSNGFVAIISEGQHKIKYISSDGVFVDDVFIDDEEVNLQFYSNDFIKTKTQTLDVETLSTGLTKFLSCANLNDNLVVTDENNLLQNFEMCRVKVRPNETVVIGERSNGDVFLVSFDGKSEGKYNGLFYFPDAVLDDVRAEVEVNIILYDEVENKIGGFINTEYISTGEKLRISFIGNIE